MTTPDPTDRLPWHEPDGSPTDVGRHEHFAIWDHEGRKWDALAAPAPDLLAAVEALPYESLTGEGAIGLVRERDTTVEVVGREAVLALIESRSVSASREAGLLAAARRVSAEAKALDHWGGVRWQVSDEAFSALRQAISRSRSTSREAGPVFDFEAQMRSSFEAGFDQGREAAVRATSREAGLDAEYARGYEVGFETGRVGREAGLDADRLAEAIDRTPSAVFWRVNDGDDRVAEVRKWAADIAAEYARLSDEPS